MVVNNTHVVIQCVVYYHVLYVKPRVCCLLPCVICYCVFNSHVLSYSTYVVRNCQKLYLLFALLFLCMTVIFVTIAKQNKWSQDILIFTKTRNDFSCSRGRVLFSYCTHRTGRRKTSCLGLQ
jgi:hypothetical protein